MNNFGIETNSESEWTRGAIGPLNKLKLIGIKGGQNGKKEISSSLSRAGEGVERVLTQTGKS